MYSMKEVCQSTGLSYEALKFYCNQGLVPNHTRDKNNRRIFSDKDIEWIKCLLLLKNCGMTHQDLKEYMQYCFAGKSSIPVRKEILLKKKESIYEQIHALEESIRYIDEKVQFYDDVSNGKVSYYSNILPPDKWND